MNLRSIFLFLSLAPSAYLTAEPFAEWWESYKQKFPVPADLVPMVDYYTHSQLSEEHTILISTHILSEVQMTCRRVMKAGRRAVTRHWRAA